MGVSGGQVLQGNSGKGRRADDLEHICLAAAAVAAGIWWVRCTGALPLVAAMV